MQAGDATLRRQCEDSVGGTILVPEPRARDPCKGVGEEGLVGSNWLLTAGGATEDAAAGGKPGVTARTRLRAVTRARWAVPRGEGGGAGKKARGPHGRAQQAVRTGGT